MPAPYDLLWSAVFVLWFVAMAVALVQLHRQLRSHSMVAVSVWFFVILLAPIVGPTLWFAFSNFTRKAALRTCGGGEARRVMVGG